MGKLFRIDKIEGFYVFTGGVYLYMERYKGVGPAFFRYPILKLPEESTAEDICDALWECERVLNENLPFIEQDNIDNVYMKMIDLMYSNFKEMGIKTPKTKIRHKAVSVDYLQKANEEIIIRSTHGLVRKEISVGPKDTYHDIAKIMKELLDE